MERKYSQPPQQTSTPRPCRNTIGIVEGPCEISPILPLSDVLRNVKSLNGGPLQHVKKPKSLIPVLRKSNKSDKSPKAARGSKENEALGIQYSPKSADRVPKEAVRASLKIIETIGNGDQLSPEMAQKSPKQPARASLKKQEIGSGDGVELSPEAAQKTPKQPARASLKKQETGSGDGVEFLPETAQKTQKPARASLKKQDNGSGDEWNAQTKLKRTSKASLRPSTLPVIPEVPVPEDGCFSGSLNHEIENCLTEHILKSPDKISSAPVVWHAPPATKKIISLKRKSTQMKSSSQELSNAKENEDSMFESSPLEILSSNKKRKTYVIKEKIHLNNSDEITETTDTGNKRGRAKRVTKKLPDTCNEEQTTVPIKRQRNPSRKATAKSNNNKETIEIQTTYPNLNPSDTGKEVKMDIVQINQQENNEEENQKTSQNEIDPSVTQKGRRKIIATKPKQQKPKLKKDTAVGTSKCPSEEVFEIKEVNSDLKKTRKNNEHKKSTKPEKKSEIEGKEIISQDMQNRALNKETETSKGEKDIDAFNTSKLNEVETGKKSSKGKPQTKYKQTKSKSKKDSDKILEKEIISQDMQNRALDNKVETVKKSAKDKSQTKYKQNKSNKDSDKIEEKKIISQDMQNRALDKEIESSECEDDMDAGNTSKLNEVETGKKSVKSKPQTKHKQKKYNKDSDKIEEKEIISQDMQNRALDNEVETVKKSAKDKPQTKYKQNKSNKESDKIEKKKIISQDMQNRALDKEIESSECEDDMDVVTTSELNEVETGKKSVKSKPQTKHKQKKSNKDSDKIEKETKKSSAQLKPTSLTDEEKMNLANSNTRYKAKSTGEKEESKLNNLRNSKTEEQVLMNESETENKEKRTVITKQRVSKTLSQKKTSCLINSTAESAASTSRQGNQANASEVRSGKKGFEDVQIRSTKQNEINSTELSQNPSSRNPPSQTGRKRRIEDTSSNCQTVDPLPKKLKQSLYNNENIDTNQIKSKSSDVEDYFGLKQTKISETRPGVVVETHLHINGFVMMGHLRLATGASVVKASTNTAYFVAEGTANVRISQTEKTISSTDEINCFFIPKISDFCISNQEEETLLLHFTKFRG